MPLRNNMKNAIIIIVVGTVVAATTFLFVRNEAGTSEDKSLQKFDGVISSPQQPQALHNPQQPSVPHPYETQDLYFHDDLLGKDMEDPAVIRAAKESIVPPAQTGPLFLENPRAVFFSQHKQDELVKKIFKNKRGGFFFEVGALTGETLSNTLHLERELGWTGVLMEPTPNSYHVLKSKNRKAYLMRACLATGRQYSQLALNMNERVWSNSLMNSSIMYGTVKVPCYPFYSVLAALGNPVVDYMSLDIEGVEMKVLQSIPWDLVNIRVMTIEINHVPEGKDALRKFMEDQGFKFIKELKLDYVFVNEKLSEGLNLKI